MAKSYWFGDMSKEEIEKQVVPYEPHWTLDSIGYARVEQNPKWKMELLNNSRTLLKVKEMIITMLMACRGKKSKTLTLSEEDFKFLFEVANEEKMIK